MFKIIRNQGTFGNVNVSWATFPVSTKDIFPEQGTVFFGNEEFSKNITIYSVPDEVNISTIVISDIYFRGGETYIVNTGKEGISFIRNCSSK